VGKVKRNAVPELSVEQLRPKRIDRSDLLVNPVFWAVHSNEQIGGDDSWLEDYFGVSLSAHESFWQQELPSVVPGEPDVFPCYFFALPLPARYSVLVDYEAYPDDFGIAYSICHPAWAAPLLLSRYNSAYDWPPFRWEEALLIADAAQGEAGKSAISRAALPLIFSGVWLTPGDDLSQVRSRLSLAWGQLHVTKPDYLAEMAARMVEAQGVLEPWQHDPDLGWINHGWNYRNPKYSPVTLFQRVQEFFGSLSKVKSVQ
jgi:hypothetical protein